MIYRWPEETLQYTANSIAAEAGGQLLRWVIHIDSGQPDDRYANLEVIAKNQSNIFTLQTPLTGNLIPARINKSLQLENQPDSTIAIRRTSFEGSEWAHLMPTPTGQQKLHRCLQAFSAMLDNIPK